MSSITPVEGFLCTDGQFFPTSEEALAHQHVIDLEKEIDEFVGYAVGSYGYQSKRAIMEWEEHKKLKELKQ